MATSLSPAPASAVHEEILFLYLGITLTMASRFRGVGFEVRPAGPRPPDAEDRRPLIGSSAGVALYKRHWAFCCAPCSVESERAREQFALPLWRVPAAPPFAPSSSARGQLDPVCKNVRGVAPRLSWT